MSSSSMPAAKRRRVDAAHETLKKPFRSPMIKRPQSNAGTGTAASSPVTGVPAQRPGSVELSRISTPSKLPNRQRPGPALSAASNSFATPSRDKTRARATPSLGQESGSKLDTLDEKDADLLERLSRRRKEAELETREVEKAMELVKQAARIESEKETGGGDLDKLVRKWKMACRIAAEELFELIRERVDSMGGGAAWRETRQQTSWFDDELAEEKRKRKEAGEETDEREELEGLEEIEESEDRDELTEERVSRHLCVRS